MRIKKIPKAKEPIKIRFKELANKNKSIYLDIYINGNRSYNFLKLYLIPELSKYDKNKNEATLKLVNAIKSRMIVNIQNGEYGFKTQKKYSNINLYDYVDKLIKHKKTVNTSNYKNYYNLVTKLKSFKGNDVRFKDIDKNFIEDFLIYLKTKAFNKSLKYSKQTNIASSSQKTYFTVFKSIINSAIRDDLLKVNPLINVSKSLIPKYSTSERAFLTSDELEKMIKTPFDEKIKRVFLFSCYCGLRISDIRDLKWNDFYVDEDNNNELHIRQKKTKNLLNVPLSKKALKYLPAQRENIDTVFEIKSETTLCRQINHWAKKAGITKHITFHSARHTNATLMLSKGADLYTVSKILGHKSIKTTQIYATVLNKNTRKAVDLL